jgi:hydrogenase maturation protease
MKSGSVDLLILGLGNPLLGDDGAGLLLLSELQRRAADWTARAEFLDGGTQGLLLLDRVAAHPALLILDAVSLGAPPGTVHVLRGLEALGLDSHHSRTAHEGNAGELLAAALLLGELPGRVFVVGIEPAEMKTGIVISEPVREALEPALAAARAIIEEALAGVAKHEYRACSCV